MASIENRSHHQVTVKNRDDLTKTFAHNHLKKAEAYSHALEAQGFKPKLSRLDNSYLIRDRSVRRAVQVLIANSKAEAKLMKEQIENEHKRNLFIDYATRRLTVNDGQSTLIPLFPRRFCSRFDPSA